MLHQCNDPLVAPAGCGFDAQGRPPRAEFVLALPTPLERQGNGKLEERQLDLPLQLAVRPLFAGCKPKV